IAAIARESNAPVGTLYHRFGSRDGVLAAAWLRALERFQQGALAAAKHPEPLEAAIAMATSQVSFAREHPDDARLLLTLRRDDLLDADPDDRFRARLEMLNAPLEATIAGFARALAGQDDSRSLDTITRAVVDLPNSAIRRHARDQRELPSWLEHDIASAARRLLEPCQGEHASEGPRHAVQ
ncbi:MAG TPA: TetR/AcrR family transcriptional regulator, partial [Solirubrobacteraceae bacterium]|nr:TetR/AcrR family transcriptional regulator [Solirubrobacteraceae bacterium]